MINKDSFNRSAADGGYAPKIAQDRPSPNNASGLTIGKAGKVKIGELVSGPKGPRPKATDHFIFTGNYKDIMSAKLGVTSTLDIFFPSDQKDKVCYDRYEMRDKAGKLFAYGDGENFTVHSDRAGGYVQLSVAENPTLVADIFNKVNQGITEDKKINHWSHALTLRFMIRDSPVAGYWELTTKADKSSIDNIVGVFESCFNTFNGVAFLVPFVLSVEIVSSNSPGPAKKYPVLSLTPKMSMEKALYLREYLNDNPQVSPAQMLRVDFEAPKEEIARQLGSKTQSNRLLAN